MTIKTCFPNAAAMQMFGGDIQVNRLGCVCTCWLCCDCLSTHTVSRMGSCADQMHLCTLTYSLSCHQCSICCVLCGLGGDCDLEKRVLGTLHTLYEVCLKPPLSDYGIADVTAHMSALAQQLDAKHSPTAKAAKDLWLATSFHSRYGQ